jgi:hypothetical protein
VDFDNLVDIIIAWVVDEARVRAFWIEAESLSELRRPYNNPRLHLCANEPSYPLLEAELSTGLAAIPGVKVREVSETARLAKQVDMEAAGLAFTIVLEQSHLLAKRQRAEVVPLVDKTGHLTHVMDFSGRRRK